VTLVAQRLAHHFFGQAVGIEVSGVDHIHPGVERHIEHALGQGHIHRTAFFKFCATAKRDGAKDDFRYQQAGMTQLSILHVASYLTLHVKV